MFDFTVKISSNVAQARNSGCELHRLGENAGLARQFPFDLSGNRIWQKETSRILHWYVYPGNTGVCFWNDANALRGAPLFKPAAGRTSLDPGNLLAFAATFFCVEGSLRRSDIYRVAGALVERFMNSRPPGHTAGTAFADYRTIRS